MQKLRVVAGLATAGVVLLVGGLALGFWPVGAGDGCGSGFAPAPTAPDCPTVLSGRSATAAQLVILGIALLGGSIALVPPRPQSEADAPGV